jgi:hypothetical protein
MPRPATLPLALLAVGLAFCCNPTMAAEGQSVAPKVEARDALPLGAKGKIAGRILSLDAKKGTVVLETAEGNLQFVPIWKGGQCREL